MNRWQRIRALLTYAHWWVAHALVPEGPESDVVLSAAGDFGSITTLTVMEHRPYISVVNTTTTTATFTLTPRTTGGTASPITFPVQGGQIVSLPTDAFSLIAPPSSSSNLKWIYSKVPITGPRAAGGTGGLSGATFVCLINYATAALTTFWQIGQGNTATNTGTGLTSAQSDILITRGGVLKNLFVNVITNALTTAPTWILEKNDADTTLLTSQAAGTTGPVSDTVHTVSVAANDKICIKLTTGGDVAAHALLAYVTLEFD